MRHRLKWPRAVAAIAVAGALVACAVHRASEPRGLVAARPYRIQVPPGYQRGKPAALMVVLHGYGASGAGQLSFFGLGAVAAARGVLVAYPDGTFDRDRKRFWNADDACCNLYGSDVDDVAYLTALIDDVERRYDVDPRRVYVVGHSNGAFMAHRLACDRASRVRAIVALAGDVWRDASRCRPDAPVAVLQVHGDADAVIPYQGGLVSGLDGGLVPSAPKVVETWAKLDGCTGGLAPTGEPRLDLDASVPGAETRREAWRCSAGAAELWTIEGGGHVPALRGDAWGNAVLDWLEAHAGAAPRPRE